MKRLAFLVLLWALPSLAQEPAATCVPPAANQTERESTCLPVRCHVDGRCECPLVLPNSRRSQRECKLSKPPSSDRTAAPPTPEKKPENVDLVTPKQRKHILDGDGKGSGGHRPGTGESGKSEFPKGWNDEKIIHEISDVATDLNSKRDKRSDGRTVVDGTRDGVLIRVILDVHGKIVTGYSLNTPKNP